RSSLRVAALAWSPDGTRFADQSGIVEATTGRRQLELPRADDAPSSMAWSPDGKRLAAFSTRTTLAVWDLDTGRESFVLKGVPPVFSLAWSPDSRWLATSTAIGWFTPGSHVAVSIW